MEGKKKKTLKIQRRHMWNGCESGRHGGHMEMVILG